MLGIYFSGTGDSKYAAELFCNECDKTAEVFSIEDEAVVDAVKEDDVLVFAYLVQYSTVHKILCEFINGDVELWKDKKIFAVATGLEFWHDSILEMLDVTAWY